MPVLMTKWQLLMTILILSGAEIDGIKHQTIDISNAPRKHLIVLISFDKSILTFQEGPKVYSTFFL